MLTALEVRNTCRRFNLFLDSQQQQRVARGHDIQRRGLVQFDHDTKDYRYWQVQSQHDQGSYEVVELKKGHHAFHCDCPDSRKHRVGLAGIQSLDCKHAIAAALELERIQAMQ